MDVEWQAVVATVISDSVEVIDAKGELTEQSQSHIRDVSIVDDSEDNDSDYCPNQKTKKVESTE